MDIYVPGCAVRPEAIIDGVVKAIAILDEKKKAMKAHASCEVHYNVSENESCSINIGGDTESAKGDGPDGK